MIVSSRNILLLLIAPLFLLPLLANAAVNYSGSAHGSSTAGVFRNGLPDPYVQGNCGHCHEQHASVNGSEPNPAGGPDLALLLAKGFNNAKVENPYNQTDSACFYCHTTGGSLQSDGIANDYYSVIFGGAPTTGTGIMEAFNQASYHNLYDVQRYITGQTAASLEFTPFKAGTSPCSGCHNVHIAKANKSNPSDPSFTAISRPTDHDSLWGDGAGEKMSDYAPAKYQAPYRYNATTFEPDGSNTSDGSNLPNMAKFCSDCHNPTSIIYSTTLGRNLEPVDWGSEMHGQGSAFDDRAGKELLDPYKDVNLGNYVLACTDCHEPHGSPNVYLIRTVVNNAAVSVASEKQYQNLCNKCHNSVAGIHHQIVSDYSEINCTTCHVFGWIDPPGYNGMAYYCGRCHYHGNDKIKAPDGSVIKIWDHKLF